MVQEFAVRQAVPQCLWGSFEFVVKMAFLDWEAAVLPLNYARGAKLFSITSLLCKFPCSIAVNFALLAPLCIYCKRRLSTGDGQASWQRSISQNPAKRSS
jgi:hypothetical protein